MVGEDLIAANVHILEYLLNSLREVHRSYLALLGDSQRQCIFILRILVLSCEVSLSEDLTDSMKGFHLELPG